MKVFSSPYILLQSIIDQSINLNLKDAIIRILKRYQLYDSNIPPLLDKFFTENQTTLNENNDEFCFIDNLKQEAYDDKITFDSDEIFQNVK